MTTALHWRLSVDDDDDAYAELCWCDIGEDHAADEHDDDEEDSLP